MFKNATCYVLEEKINFDELERKLSEKPLIDILASEEKTIGFLPVFDGFTQRINDAIFINLGIEEKTVSKKAIDTEFKKRAKDQELSRSEIKEMKERIYDELIVKAPAVQSNMLAYFDLKSNMLVVDANSHKKANELTSYLRKTIGSLPIVPLSIKSSVESILTSMAIADYASDQLNIEQDIHLRSLDDEKRTSKYKNVDIGIASEELKQGWQVTKLAFTYNDMMSFYLDQHFIFKRLQSTDGFDNKMNESYGVNEDDAKEVELYLMVDMLRNMINHVKDLFNGFE